MASSNVYMFKNVIVDLNGVQVQDFAEGEDVVSVELENDRVKSYVGADGGSGQNVSPNKSGTLKLKVMATSAICTTLALMYQSLDTVPVVANVLIRSSQGADFVSGNFLVSNVKYDRGQEYPVYEYDLKSSDIEIFAAAVSMAIEPSRVT